MSSAERPYPNILSDIDQLLQDMQDNRAIVGSEPVAPKEEVLPRAEFGLKEVRNFTGWVWQHHDKPEMNMAEEAEEISVLKEESLVLATKKKGTFLPGSQPLYKEYNEIKELRNINYSHFNRAYIELRNKALSHVLLSSPSALPDEVKGRVSNIRETYSSIYTQLEEAYKGRHSKNI